MPTYKSHRIRLEPTNVQRTQLAKHAGVARYAYNWAVEIGQKVYAEMKISLSAIDLNKMFVRMEKWKHDWLYDVSKCASSEAIRNYEEAIKNFYAKQKPSNYTNKRLAKTNKVTGEKKYVIEGLPQKKKKGKSRDSFYLEDGGGVRVFQISGNKIKLPKIGWVRTSEIIPQGTIIKNCVISRTADEWFVSYRQEIEPTKHNKTSRVGVDLGIKTHATVSDGTTFSAPQKFNKLASKMRREQKSLRRKYESNKKLNEKNKQLAKKNKTEFVHVEKSNNYRKNQARVAKLHQRIANHRADATHKITSYLTKNHGQVVIEDLNVKGMLKNRNLAKSLNNVNFGAFRRQMEYKGEWYGCEIIVADRFFPSSKRCSCCGEINKNLKLSQRVWTCEKCGTKHERDLNAAVNLRDYPIGGYAASSAVKACGDGSSAHVAHSLSVKQEINTEHPSGVFG